MPARAPLKAQSQQAVQVLPFEQAPQTSSSQPAPVTAPEIVVRPAIEPPPATSAYPAKPREVFELDHMVPAVMPATTNSAYPAKPREVFELDHSGER
jgi:hypothetical protein